MKIKVKRNARIAITLTFLTTFASGSSIAADYRVDFGAETSAGKDAGSLRCAFERTCIAEMKSLGLTISLRLVPSEPERANVMLYGAERDCCLFAGAVESIDVDPRKPMFRTSFYRGIKAKGALLIENQRVGTLYLRFSRADP